MPNHTTTMNTKKVMSIVVLVTAAAIFALSSVVVKPVVAQSYGGGGGGNAGASDSENYKEFQKCLSDAKTNGVVTEQQIRDCFSPIYNPSGGSDDTTNYGNNDYGSGDSSSISSDTNYGNNDGNGYNDDMEENEQK
jgi:hypothetical protein